MVKKVLRGKLEQFCLHYLQGKSATQAAILVGYSPATAAQAASRIMRQDKVRQRLNELSNQAAAPAIMTVLERKQRLTEIARARLTDFVEAGPDGAWINIGLESVNSAALQEIVTKTEYDDDGSHPTVITRIKLRDPVGAIQELNKMDGSYAPIKQVLTGLDDGPIRHAVLTLDAKTVQEAIRALVDAGAIGASPALVVPDTALANW